MGFVRFTSSIPHEAMDNVISQIPRFNLRIISSRLIDVPMTLDTMLDGFLVGFLQKDSHLAKYVQYFFNIIPTVITPIFKIPSRHQLPFFLLFN